MKAKKLFETEHFILSGNIYTTDASVAEITFKSEDAPRIGSCQLSFDDMFGDKQENGLIGYTLLFGDKFQTYVCDYERYGEFVRCIDEFNDLVLEATKKEENN